MRKWKYQNIGLILGRASQEEYYEVQYTFWKVSPSISMNSQPYADVLCFPPKIELQLNGEIIFGQVLTKRRVLFSPSQFLQRNCGQTTLTCLAPG